MKPILVSVLALSVCVFTATAQTVEREFKVAMGKKLEIDLKTGGSINIVGWDRELLTAEVRFEGRDADDAKIDFDQTSAGVVIRSFYRSSERSRSLSAELEIRVPKRFNIEIKSTGGGIRIADVQGNFEGKTMGGALDLRNLKGTLHLTTMGGAITLKNSDVDGSLKTMGGRILLEDVTGDIKATSQGGNVIQRNVSSRSARTSEGEVNITTQGGNIQVDDAPLGTNVKTMGGNIHIQSVRKYAKAETMGGNIEIAALDGWAQATTMGGNIIVTMVGDPGLGDRNVHLRSMSGDITLTVHSELSMDIDVTLAYTRDSKQRYKVVSDFPLNRSESAEWEYGDGSPRKYIHATGTTRGGKNNVRISTVNGNVYLKKN